MPTKPIGSIFLVCSCLAVGLVAAPLGLAAVQRIEQAASTDAASQQENTPAKSNNGERQQPIHLRADRIEVNQQRAVTVYQGHVVFAQGGLRFTADYAEVRHNPRNHQPQTISARGKPVSFKQRGATAATELEGSAQRLEFSAPDNTLRLYDKVLLKHGKDRFQGASLYYDLTQKTFVAQSDTNARVRVVLHPETPETPDYLKKTKPLRFPRSP